MADTLSLSELFKRDSHVLRESSSTRPRIFVVEEEGTRVVIKDFTPNGFFFRNIIGRFLIWREAKAYRKMRGLRGIPKFYRIINGLAIVVQEIQGKPLERVKEGHLLPDGFIDTLKRLIDEVHKRGIAHCDLKRAGNIILGNDGMPYIIDWGASIFDSEFRLPLLKAVYRRFVLDDNMAIVKLKLRYARDTITDEDMARYGHRSKAEKLVRKIRDNLRNILKLIA